MMNADPRQEFATQVVARLRETGFEAYWAGGCVRDLLLGIEPSDFDIATDARPEQVIKLFRRTCAVGASFGVVRVLGSASTGDVEVATFRSDGVYLDGRRPETVTYSTAEFDASRRDFTINGMFYDPIEQRVIDHVGGRADLESGLLRAIGDPSARFAEDKLRLLRAVRFASRFGLAIEPETRRALGAMASKVTTVSVERIAQELRRMLIDPSRVGAMTLADETGLLAAVLPELMLIKGRNVWDRTIRVLANLPDSPSFPLALAALLHEVRMPTDGERRERAGRDVAWRVATRLKLANAERDRTAWLVEHHHALEGAADQPESKLKRLLATDGIVELLALHRAIALASTGDVSHVDYSERYLRDQPAGPINPPPLLTGHDLARHGLRPSPRFAMLLDKVRDAQLNRLIDSKAEAIELVDRILANVGET